MKWEGKEDAAALEKNVAGECAAENGLQVRDGEEFQRNHLAAREKRLREREGKGIRR